MGARTNLQFEIIIWNYWHALCYKVENSDRLCCLSIVVWKWIETTQVEGFKITNLTSHEIIMEIVQNSFNRNSYVSHTNIMHWKHIWNMDLLEDAKFVWHLFIHKFVLHLLTHLSLSNVFSTHDIRAENIWTYEWMNVTWFSLLICHMLNLWLITKMEQKYIVIVLSNWYEFFWEVISFVTFIKLCFFAQCVHVDVMF